MSILQSLFLSPSSHGVNLQKLFSNLTDTANILGYFPSISCMMRTYGAGFNRSDFDDFSSAEIGKYCSLIGYNRPGTYKYLIRTLWQ
jgi:hypothetical protein